MKLAIDCITKLDDSLEQYRRDLINSFALEDDIRLIVLYRDKDMNRAGGLDYKRVNKSLFRLQPGLYRELKKSKVDVFLLFSPVKQNIRTKVETYLFIDHLIQINSDGKLSKNSRKLVNSLKDYKGLITRTNYKKLYITNNYSIEKSKFLTIYQNPQAIFDAPKIIKNERKLRQIFSIYGVAKPYLYLAGSLEDNQTIENLLIAFSQISPKYPDLKLIVSSLEFKLGWDGKALPLNNRAKEVLELIDKYKLNRKVIFIGRIDKEHVPLIINNAEICLDLIDYKRFSNSLVEQLAAGCCLIVHDNAVAREIVSGGGFICNASVVTSVKESMLDLLDDDSLRKKYRLKAYERYQELSYSNTVNTFTKYMKNELRTKQKLTLLLIGEDSSIQKRLQLLLSRFFEIKEGVSSTSFRNFWSMRNYDYIFWTNEINLRFLYVCIATIRIKKFVHKEIKRNQERGLFNILKTLMHSLFEIIVLNIFVTRVFVFDRDKVPKRVKRLIFKNKVKPILLPFVLPKKNQKVMQEKLELKGYIGITYIASNFLDKKEQVDLLLKISKTGKYKIFVLGDLKINSSRVIGISRNELDKHMAASTIYINFDKNLTPDQILDAYYHANLIIVSKAASFGPYFTTGINGYSFNPKQKDEIIALLKRLEESRKHTKDIAKINKVMLEKYDVSNVEIDFKKILDNI